MKKLLLIGNKPLERDYTENIKDFDMVVRVNRMTNYEMCQGKTDLWLADVFDSSVDLYNKEPQKKFAIAKKVVMFEHNKDCTLEYISKFDKKEITIVDFDSLPIRKYIPMYDYDSCGRRITNAIWLLIYCLENYSNNYKIYTLGLGGRKFLKSSAHYWHSEIYKQETYLYETLVKKEKITPIDETFEQEETFKRGYTGHIPLFSSFWHNTENSLPPLVVASINSFVKNGCPYHLYTYKDYDNIPLGCVVKDANEIVPFSEFFIGSRNYISSFSNMFRVYLVNKVDTAWTDTDNYFISDDFPTKNVLIEQDGRIQNSFFYLSNDAQGQSFKRLLLDFYEDPVKKQQYDNDEMCYDKRCISIYKGRMAQLKNACWGMGGSHLYTNIKDVVDVRNAIYPYEKYFNDFHYTEQYQLWNWEEHEYMKYCNRNVRILVMSLALLHREPQIMKNYNEKSYMANIIKKYS